MKVLTVRPPWAWCIIHGGKNIENRSRAVAKNLLGEPLAIHVGLTVSPEGAADPMVAHALQAEANRGSNMLHRFDFTGVVLGIVTVLGSHHADECWDDHAEAHCSPWAMADHHHWVVADPRPLLDPFPYTGALPVRDLKGISHAQLVTRAP